MASLLSCETLFSDLPRVRSEISSSASILSNGVLPQLQSKSMPSTTFLGLLPLFITTNDFSAPRFELQDSDDGDGDDHDSSRASRLRILHEEFASVCQSELVQPWLLVAALESIPQELTELANRWPQSVPSKEGEFKEWTKQTKACAQLLQPHLLVGYKSVIERIRSFCAEMNESKSSDDEKVIACASLFVGFRLYDHYLSSQLYVRPPYLQSDFKLTFFGPEFFFARRSQLRFPPSCTVHWM